MNTKEQIESLIMAMLRNPKAWTYMQASSYFGCEIDLANDRVKIRVVHYEEQEVKSGALWFRTTNIKPAQFLGNYTVLGPSGHQIFRGRLDGEEAYTLAHALVSRSAIHSIQGNPWPSGEPCAYCGTPLTDGRCSTCGAAKTSQKPAIA